jgi:hypothetical protein
MIASHQLVGEEIGSGVPLIQTYFYSPLPMSDAVARFGQAIVQGLLAQT